MTRLKPLAQNIGLAAASALVFYLALEFAVLPSGLVHFPHRLQWRTVDPLLVITQNSRKHRVPRDFIAIAGDSHAMGIISDDAGLAKWSSRGRASDAYLFEKTGRDILAVGQGGAGSLGGIVGTPLATAEFLNRTWFYGLERPAVILAYFYEGNDLDDNIRELRQRYDGRYDAARFRDPAYFRGFIKDVVLAEHKLYRRAQDFHWHDNLMLLGLGRTFLDKAWERLTVKRPPPAPGGGTHAAAQGVNRVRVAGREVVIPDKLQAPSLELAPSETKRALYVFEQSLRFLADSVPEAKIYVVYVPSPLSCYELASRRVSVESYHERGGTYDARLVGTRSDFIAREIGRAAQRAQAGFIDSRGAMRAAGRERLLHGPQDWYHPNRWGYAALGEAILQRLSADRSDRP